MKKISLNNQNIQDKINANLINRNFDEIIAEGFNRYAKYIIQDRALPELKDGLKPVQRRILYAMYKLNLSPESQFKKSARTVGDVLGKYHPHGDSSIYEALIRMAQDWKNNLPQIEVHGNKGSIDDDPAAAMRYTEARLSYYGQELLSDIEKKIYPFVNNFDDTETEPTILSCLLPNLLINGASGIAAGYATSIPTFNLSELLNAIIFMVKNKNNITLEQLLQIIPGPDFPTGGIVSDLNEIKNCYLNGEAKINIRSSYKVIQDKKNKTKIVIDSIPYETIKSDIVKQIEDLRSNDKLPSINSVIDASDKNGIAIELELNNNNIDVQHIMAFLYKKTDLQVNFSANMVVIHDKKPLKIGVIDYLKYFIDYAINNIVSVQKYLLNQDEEKYEVVLGLIQAVSVLDEIIHIIRQSKNKEDSIDNLIKRFNFTKKQAEAIVQLRLYKLSNTDLVLLHKDEQELKQKIAFHQNIIENKKEQNKYLINKLQAYIKQFGYTRKSIIENEISNLESNEKDLIQNKPVYLFVSKQNQAKTISKIDDKTLNTPINFKNNDDYINLCLASNLKNTVLFFSNLGRMVSLDTFKIPETKWKDNGLDLSTKLHLYAHEKIIAILDLQTCKENKNGSLIFVSKQGKIKQIPLSIFLNKKDIKLSSCISLETNDELISVLVSSNTENNYISLFSNKGNILNFSVQQIPVQGLKAKGCNGMKLNKNDFITTAFVNENKQQTLLLCTKYSYKLLDLNELETTNRYLIGKNILNSTKKKEEIIFVCDAKQNVYGYDEQNNLINIKTLNIKNTTNWLKFDSIMSSFLVLSKTND